MQLLIDPFRFQVIRLIGAQKLIDQLKYEKPSQLIRLVWQDAVPQGLFERFTCAFVKHCDGKEGLEFRSLAKNLAQLKFRKLNVAIENESTEVHSTFMMVFCPPSGSWYASL